MNSRVKSLYAKVQAQDAGCCHSHRTVAVPIRIFSDATSYYITVALTTSIRPGDPQAIKTLFPAGYHHDGSVISWYLAFCPNNFNAYFS